METTKFFYTSVRETCPTRDYEELAMIVRNAPPTLFLVNTKGWISPSEYYALMSGENILSNSNVEFFKSLRMVWQIQRMFSTEEELENGLIPNLFKFCLDTLKSDVKHKINVLKILDILNQPLTSYLKNHFPHLVCFKKFLDNGNDLGVLYEKLWKPICDFYDWYKSGGDFQRYLSTNGAITLFKGQRFKVLFFRKDTKPNQIRSFVRERASDIFLVIFEINQPDILMHETQAVCCINTFEEKVYVMERLLELGINNSDLFSRIKALA